MYVEETVRSGNGFTTTSPAGSVGFATGAGGAVTQATDRATGVTVAAGSFEISVANDNAAGGTAETGTIIINFAVIKAVAA